MKSVRRGAEFLRISADFIQGDQPVEAIKRRVLNPLGHDRSRELLKPQNKITLRLPGVRQQQKPFYQ